MVFREYVFAVSCEVGSKSQDEKYGWVLGFEFSLLWQHRHRRQFVASNFLAIPLWGVESLHA